MLNHLSKSRKRRQYFSGLYVKQITSKAETMLAEAHFTPFFSIFVGFFRIYRNNNKKFFNYFYIIFLFL